MTQGDEKLNWVEELITLLSQVAIIEYVDGLSSGLNREPPDLGSSLARSKGVCPRGEMGWRLRLQKLDSDNRGINKLLDSEKKSENVEIAVTRTPPKVTTEKVNELGIRERIGKGESYYAHSIPNRIFNVGLVSSRANSALIAPGEEFSFNRIVGEISGATGYKEAYVISGGRTVLGDGGGVCQVSTTLFRGAMNAGLPITERWAHAYRVGYYEQNSKAGIDATVYAPSKDLRFLNDTPGHILVQLINDPKNLHLVVEIYGTSDGRVATISEPKVWGVSPPPPDIVQEDPSLPVGTTKQVDWSAWGAKTSFEYRVVRDGEILQEKTYTSAYRPWANVYLKGTGSASAL
jgi:vancomycin resistance protein YoaR